MSKVFTDLLAGWLDDDDEDFVFFERELAGMIPVESSNLAGVKYNQRKKMLFVAFLDGSIYLYEQVPPHIYRGLIAAESHGSYFRHNIRLSFYYERIVG